MEVITLNYNPKIVHNYRFRSQFPPSTSSQVTFEKTPKYFTRRIVPSRINQTYAEENQNIKFLLLLCDPTMRVFSDYSHDLRQNEALWRPEWVSEKVKISLFKIAVNLYQNQIKYFITLAVLPKSVLRVCGAHFCVIASGQHCFFLRNVAAVAIRWQHCVRFDRSEI